LKKYRGIGGNFTLVGSSNREPHSSQVLYRAPAAPQPSIVIRDGPDNRETLDPTLF
jgi:hypothetical protein